ncbi:MAG: RNA polymerase sporulation sigma factor SigE [Eubacteriales bacterium]|nr:RNA polymerase sporulation sigma factor SigE [Eubacteriales bacterium]MDD4475948.1 RNA polymerase sporulation sigma factor SigE [Eubacteriales bacterium]
MTLNEFKLIVRRLFLSITGREDELYYINGPQTLPPPLDKEEEQYLLERLDGDVSARNKLVERNLRLVVYIAKKFENTGIGIEDLVSIGTIGLMKAISSFKIDKQIKLATYASRCIENEILMFIRKNSNQKHEMSIDEPLSIDWDGNELSLSDLLGTDTDYVSLPLEEEEEKLLIRRALSKLCGRDREIIELRFGLNDPKGRELTQKEVADMLGISQSYISRLEKKIIKKLREELTACGGI